MLLNDLHHRARHEILTPSFATLAHGEKDLPSVMPIAVVHSTISLSSDVDNHTAVLALSDRSDLFLGNQLRPSQPTTE
jgi:hypothetical protein